MLFWVHLDVGEVQSLKKLVHVTAEVLVRLVANNLLVVVLVDVTECTICMQMIIARLLYISLRCSAYQ